MMPSDAYESDPIVVRGPAGSGPLGALGGTRVRGRIAEAAAEGLIARDALAALIARGPVDLHIHTTASDGTENPAQILKRILAAGLAGFALADHDSLAGIGDMTMLLDKMAMLGLALPDFVPAVELAMADEGQELHLLAYFPHGGEALLSGFIASQGAARDVRNREICARLQALGYPIDAAALAREGNHALGRPHIAQLLVREGRVRDVEQAFDELLAEGRPAYVPRPLATAETLLRLVRDAGGVPVLAHPAQYGWCGRGDGELGRRLDALVALGLEGLEVVHGETDAAQRAELAEAARARGLLRSAGSDYHGRRRRGGRIYTAADDWRALLVD